MIKNDKPVRDVFTFSLGGITTISAFVAVPVIADDRLRQIPPSRVRRSGEQKRRLWLPKRFRVA